MSVIAQSGNEMLVAWYHSVEVSNPFMIRALPLRLRSLCFQAAIVFVIL